jgi:hypothetical protein
MIKHSLSQINAIDSLFAFLNNMQHYNQTLREKNKQTV